MQEWHELLARYSAVFSTLGNAASRSATASANEFEALERLATCDFKCRSADLTEAVHLSQSATSRLVARYLEKEGLVERAVRNGPARHLRHHHRRRPGEKYLAAKGTHREVLNETLR